MKNLNVQKPFNPDVVLVIRHDSVTGDTRIESGNGKPISAMQVAILAVNIAKFNIESLASQAAAQIVQQHDFYALDGEDKCRVPRCGMPREHAVHTPAPAQTAVQ